ncbi:MAG: DUF177 domain-containing protein [Bacteroidales bacterium]|nr:DUF177 domain-containing protein [Bacteroidales bacterium]
MGKEPDNLYTIPVKGLSVGKHQYSFLIDKKFFEDFENSQILGASLKVDVDLERSETWIRIVSAIHGTISVECDRCLDELVIPLKTEASLLVRFVKNEDEPEEDLETITLDPSEVILDLRQFFYDYICLSMPMQMVHEEGKCDPEMIARLENARGEKPVGENGSPFDRLKDLLN